VSVSAVALIWFAPEIHHLMENPNAVGCAPIHTFYSNTAWIEGKAVEQLKAVAAVSGIKAVAAMPDLHPGKYGPVGCAILADAVHPAFAGSDIGCGMSLFQLDIQRHKLRLDKLADRLRALDEPWDGDGHAELEGRGLPETPFDAVLGSIGGGNHFCEMQALDEVLEPQIAKQAGLDASLTYLLVHSGSRGLGFAILEKQLAAGITALDRDSDAERDYLAAHNQALGWASLNRQIIAERAAKAARSDARLIADLSHNFIERTIEGFLHRKGVTPSDRGLVPVPGSRAAPSYLVEPIKPGPPAALSSVAHGAGRKYDRASMHGRLRAKKSDLAQLSRNPFGGLVICEDSGLLVEEAGDAYKNVDSVIGDLAAFGLGIVVARFKPLITFKTARISATERSKKSSRRSRR
jgi:release factor H-coupled RctB family protein